MLALAAAPVLFSSRTKLLTLAVLRAGPRPVTLKFETVKRPTTPAPVAAPLSRSKNAPLIPLADAVTPATERLVETFASDTWMMSVLALFNVMVDFSKENLA